MGASPVSYRQNFLVFFVLPAKQKRDIGIGCPVASSAAAVLAA